MCRKLHVDRIDREIENGSTEPFLAVLSSEGEEFHAIIKVKDNQQGILSVINELISYKLATSVGILMPESGVAIVDESTNGESFIRKKSFGHCFYSRLIEKVGILNECVMDLVSNKEMYEKVILFDHLVYNKDRNKGNLLITVGKGSKLIYAIDHTHVFKNETIWDRVCFKQGIEQNDYLDKDILDTNGYSLFFHSKNITLDSLEKEAELFQDIITEPLLNNIISEIPEDWSINVEDIEALKEYLLYRASHMKDICKMIIKYRNGGRDYE